MPEKSPVADSNATRWLLRRADQAGVAVLVLLGLVSTAAWSISHGGCRGRLVELEEMPARTAQFEVDLNEAQWPELAQLPGIGETLARRIIDSRGKAGPFLDHDDLQRVRGIGPKTVEKLRPFLRPMPQHGTIAGDDLPAPDQS